MKKLKEIQENLNIKNIFPEYKIKKEIFQLTFGILLIIFGITMITSSNQNYLYVECNQPVCVNPLYSCNPDNIFGYEPDNKICDLTNESMYKYEYLLKGEKLGTKPPFVLRHSITIFLFLILSAFLLNHYLYNKDYKTLKIKIRR